MNDDLHRKINHFLQLSKKMAVSCLYEQDQNMHMCFIILLTHLIESDSF